METTCLILDNEPDARNVLRNHIEKIKDLKIVAECNEAMEAISVLRNQSVDLMFSVIQMPEVSGIDVIKSLENPPRIIFTSVNRDYALEGYELNVLDYLIKPITFGRLLKAVNKFYQVNNRANVSTEENTSNLQSVKDFVYVRENKRYVKVRLDEILYIEGLGEYIQIFMEKKKIVTKIGLNDFEKKLSQSGFIRIHKSHIVNMSKIEAFTAQTIEVVGKKLIIGRSYKDLVSEALMKFR